MNRREVDRLDDDDDDSTLRATATASRPLFDIATRDGLRPVSLVTDRNLEASMMMFFFEDYLSEG